MPAAAAAAKSIASYPVPSRLMILHRFMVAIISAVTGCNATIRASQVATAARPSSESSSGTLTASIPPASANTASSIAACSRLACASATIAIGIPTPLVVPVSELLPADCRLLCLTFHRSCADAGHDVALHEDVENDRGNREDHPGGEQALDRRVKHRDHRGETRRGRLQIVFGDHRLCEEIFVPGVEESDDADRHQPRQR